MCFTGHRTLLEPRQDVEKKLEDVVRRCIVNGARTFITGGAIGFDTITAQLILRLRSEFPNIYLALALPWFCQMIIPSMQGLHCEYINGKPCLVRNDIDMEQKDHKGRTNRERMEQGVW